MFVVVADGTLLGDPSDEEEAKKNFKISDFSFFAHFAHFVVNFKMSLNILQSLFTLSLSL